MVHTQHLDARDLVNQRFQHRACQLQQLLPGLLDEVPSFFLRQRFAELSFGESQDTANADHQEVFDGVDVDLLRPPSQYSS